MRHDGDVRDLLSKPAVLAAGGVLVGLALIARALRQFRVIDLRGKTAVVTGGSRGLGLLIATELGRLGARTVLVARDAAELERARNALRAEGIDVSTIVADLTDRDDAERVVSETVSRFGAVDVLVNNAGTIKVGPMEHMGLEDFDEAMAVHFWGPLHTMRAAIPHMRRQGGGRIVNVSSIGGKIGVPHLVPYSASKFALTGLSSAAAAELARENILVTTVCPGLMRTGSFFNAWFKGRHRAEFAWFAIADSLPMVSIAGRRAAVQIVDAAVHGDAELFVSWPARLAVMAAAVVPNTFATMMAVTNRLLPPPGDSSDHTSWSGWQSTSRWAPSTLTHFSDRPAADNNELG
jgi:NAD(P)-dependent dehydrogenase (short-subunit alcohol dehydrogenase family)